MSVREGPGIRALLQRSIRSSASCSTYASGAATGVHGIGCGGSDEPFGAAMRISVIFAGFRVYREAVHAR